MFASFRKVAVFSLVCACGPSEGDAPTEPPSEPQSESAPEIQAPLEDELVDDEVPLEDVDVDEMDEHALEAACFAGQQAACDQLGH